MKKRTALTTNVFALVANLIASVAIVFVSTEPVTASPLTYEDPVTSATIHRITTNAGGADNCLNFLATAAGASSNWSQDSQRIVYTRSCEGDISQNGIYVYDLQNKQSSCVAQTSKHWTYPTFDHSSSGGKIYYIDGSDLGARPKPYAVYSVDVPNQLNFNQLTSSCLPKTISNLAAILYSPPTSDTMMGTCAPSFLNPMVNCIHHGISIIPKIHPTTVEVMAILPYGVRMTLT